jgi:hypothetical protein
MARKQCKIDAEADVKRDILECSAEVREEIGGFLESLQGDPLPRERSPMGTGAFYLQLPCGVFVGWEIVGDLLHLVLHGPDETYLVRILGVGWDPPAIL